MPDPRHPARHPAATADNAPHAAITEFIALLEREQHILARPQADALEAIATQKQVLLDQLDPRGRGILAARQDPALRALVARARHLNAANARLLAIHRNACDNRLQVLRGGPSTNTLYRANGLLGA